MNKKTLYKMFISAFMMFVILLIMKTNSNAASLSISPSKTSVSPGESFTITVSVSGGAGKVNLSASNATLDSTSLELMLQSSKNVTCTAGTSGTININASGIIADYTTENDETKYASASVTINSTNNNGGGTTTSTNANLSNLGITPNDFSGFSASKTSYSVNVPNEVSQITIYANKGDSSQTITGTGTKTLKEGTNKFNIVVKAAAGNTKTYTISVIRATLEGEDVPNVDENEEETNEQEESNGIVLDSLEIEGFELEPEFDPTVKEYTVKIDKKITSLEELKSLVKAILNDENYIVEVLTEEELKEDKNIINIIIRDEEREYSKYTITFVNEEIEAESENHNQDTTNDNDDTFTILGYEFDKDMIPVFVMLGCTILAISIGILLAIIAFIKSKKLKEYQEDNNYYDEDLDVIENVEQNVPENEKSEENKNEEETKENEEKNQFRRPGYRSKGKKGRGTGRHF